MNESNRTQLVELPADESKRDMDTEPPGLHMRVELNESNIRYLEYMVNQMSSNAKQVINFLNWNYKFNKIH